MAEPVPVIMVNHVAMDMAAEPDAVWSLILEDYVEAKKFREAGGDIEPIDDPAAVFGGYRMLSSRQGEVIDERIIRFTERDETARRLSVAADYLSVPGGMQVYVTYHALETPDGTRYTIDCHSTLHLTDAGTGISATLAAATAEADAHLIAYLANAKARLHAGD